ncbi:RHS repeat-associated core domain-containing protein [Arsenophonus sp.]|uniref:RHS repeat-associated core domain-containing protein n=1 Tax=Arsenophonus sp. TaxID=1872640 RepID=UPI00387A7A14
MSSEEEFFPFGGTAWWAAENQLENHYKTYRYSGKERDATGLYYYGFRYYQPWVGRWLNPDPAGIIDGLNLYRMVRNNPVNLSDPKGNSPLKKLFGKNKKQKENITAAIAPVAIQRPEQKEYSSQIAMDSMYQQIDKDMKITYLSEEQRLYNEIEVDSEGLLRNKESQSLFNQNNTFGESVNYTVWNETEFAYVISTNKKLYLSKHVTGSFHHSSFMAEADVLDAGMMSVISGNIISLSTKSGHYKPTIIQKLATIDYLKDNNANLSQTKVINVDGSGYLYEKNLYRADSMYLKGMKATETNIAANTLIPENVSAMERREIYRKKLSEFTHYQIKKSLNSANASTRL